MKHAVIIGSRQSGDKNNPAVLASRLKSPEVETSEVYWEDLVFDIRTDKVSISVKGTELRELQPALVVAVNWYKSGAEAFYKDIAYSLALYLDHHGIAFWNREMLSQRSTTKLSCMVQLALLGIPVPHTRYAVSTAQLLEGQGAYPAVVKSFAASRGKNNYLVHSREEAMEKLGDGSNTYLFQPYLENDHDLRVICFGGKPRLILRRSRAQDSDSHLNNTSLGGSATWLETSAVAPQLLTDAEKICTVMRRELAGIDFIPDTAAPSGYSCLEVNAIPQLTSGTDIDKKLETMAAVLAEELRSEA